MNPFAQRRRFAPGAIAVLSILSACGGGESPPTIEDSHAHAMAVTVTSSSPGYFVDASRGNDNNNGTYAAPFQKLKQLMIKLSNRPLQAGEGIYLRCDDPNGNANIWRESLSLDATVLAANGARVAGYGACTSTVKATLSGADNFSGGWAKGTTLPSGCTMWSRPVPSGTRKITRLLVGDRVMRTAQWPNYVAGSYDAQGVLINAREYGIADAGSSGNLLYPGAGLNGLSLPATSLEGATVQLRSLAYYVEQRQVTAYDATKLTLSATALGTDHLAPGDGYVLQDKAWMLDDDGEFLHDTAASTLSVCIKGTDMNASSTLVEGSVRNNVAVVRGRSGVAVSNLELRMGRGDGLVLWDAPSADVSAVNASYNGRAGIRLQGGVQNAGQAGTSVRLSTLRQNWIYGIDSWAASGSHSISGNVIYDTGTEGYAGGSRPPMFGTGDASDIMVGYDFISAVAAGSGATVDGNDIQHTAMSGIRYKGAVTITNNDVTDFCRRMSDCGAIYTWVGTAVPVTSLPSVGISGNRLVDGRIDRLGVLADDINKNTVAGIYLDDYAANADVNGNTVLRSPVGVYVHNGRKNRVRNNKLWLTTLKGLYVNVDQSDVLSAAGNVYQSNEIAPLANVTGMGWNGTKFTTVPDITPSYAFFVSSKFDSTTLLNADNHHFQTNRVVQLNGPFNETAYYKPGLSSSSIERRLTAQGWKSLNPDETLSPSVPSTFSLYKLEEDRDPLETFPATATATPPKLQWRSGPAGFAVTSGSAYVLRFTANFKGTARVRPNFVDAAASAAEVPFDTDHPSPNWAGVYGLGFPTGSTGETFTYEGFATSLGNATDGRYQLGLAGTDSGVAVELTFAQATRLIGYNVADNRDWMSLLSAPRGSALVVDHCSVLGWTDGCVVKDINGNAVTPGPGLIVPAGTAMLFLRVDSTWHKP